MIRPGAGDSFAVGAFMTLVPDFEPFAISNAPPGPNRGSASPLFWQVKDIADFLGAIALLLPISVLALVLLALNPLLNPGPLLFRQRRMGQHGVTFTVLKFRTMAHAPPRRGPNDPVELGRIGRLGRFLRRTGLDELPQAFNILRGEMSLIGPRPDCAHHARVFLDAIPEYRHRLTIKPGISGYAQVRLGYAVGLEATRAKARADFEYIRRAGIGMDLWIAWRTMLTVMTARGD